MVKTIILREGTPESGAKKALENIYQTEKWDNKAPTALLIGRYQAISYRA